MLARLVRDLPEGDYVFEPKWDGFRALIFRDGEHVDVRSRNDRPLARYFPEVVEAVRSIVEPRFVLDGEIVVVGPRGLDFAALMARLHPAATRVAQLRNETPAALIAFDVLAIGDDDLVEMPFDERRARLETLLEGAPSNVLPTPATRDRETACAWLERFHGGGIDGVVAKPPTLRYRPNERAMFKVKKARTADCVVAGVRLHAGRPMVGSLLLGLHDETGGLVHIGVASQFTEARRRQLLEEIRPLVVRLEGHPWERGFGLERSPLGRLAGSAGRWTPGEMERDWIPLSPTRVCEVSYDTLDERRLRHPARFVRWRDDRTAASCGFDQFEASLPDVRALLAS
jgi:ATP-dependent DNA ligase